MNQFPTSRQLDIMKTVLSLQEDKHKSPTTAMLATELKMTDRGAKGQLESLERKGLLVAEKSRTGWRRWKVTPQGMAWIEAL